MSTFLSSLLKFLVLSFIFRLVPGDSRCVYNFEGMYMDYQKLLVHYSGQGQFNQASDIKLIS